MKTSRFTPLIVILLLSLLPTQLLSSPALDTVLRIMLLLVGTYAVSHTTRHLGVMVILAVPVVALQLVPLASNRLEWQAAALGSSVFLLTYVALITLRAVLGSRHVSADVLMGGAAVYILFGLVWASAYALTEIADPGSFRSPTYQDVEFPFIYFSFVTLTSVGYGDIAPVGAIARHLAIFEALFGQLYLALFIGRLVGVPFGVPLRPRDLEP